jgi:hypothetical protein
MKRFKQRPQLQKSEEDPYLCALCDRYWEQMTGIFGFHRLRKMPQS